MKTIHGVRISLALPLLLVVFLLCTLVSSSQLAKAAGETITAGSTAATQVKAATNITGIQINGTDNSTVPVKLLVANGTLAMSTTTGLTFTGSQTGSTLYFSGTRSDVNAALATLTYTRNTTGTDTLEISLVSSGEVFFAGTGHLYEYVSATYDWNGARTAAAGRTKYGATGYLATITSQAENDFVSARLTNAGWMGSSDSVSEGVWRWVTGPETNTQFWQGAANGNTVGGSYANWSNGEPNDYGTGEDCGQFLSGGSGQWNDLPCSGLTLPGYVVEYGAPGNMPTVAAANISLTTSDTIAPTVPGAPTTTSPTTTQKPTWSWGASTDTGVGLATPAYSIQWSQSSDFSSGVNSATSTINSYTHSTNLADGAWYFRVRASDTASNTSAYSAAGLVVVDTIAPTTPGVTALTTYTNSTIPNFNWTASSDAGAGLVNPAYTVQRSQSSTFASGNTSSTTNSTSYTAPNLTEGTWYFRVAASDTLSHMSAWSSTLTFVIDTTAPMAPGAVSTITPTSNQKPTWAWSTSSDNGSGLANPAYRVEWSQSATFVSGVTDATTNTTSFTQPTNLTDGTWYFRVRATDRAGNDSVYSSAGSVVIDTAAPVISALTAISVSKASQTIAWTTDKLSSSLVEYGPTISYGSTVHRDTAPRVTAHSVPLTDLVACTLYHYRIASTDAVSNTVTNSGGTFITTGCASEAEVVTHTDTVINTSTGGSVSLSHDDTSVNLIVPAQIGGPNADFQIKKLDSGSAFTVIGVPNGVSPVSTAYDIKAMEDTTTPITGFSSPVTVTMTFKPTEVARFTVGSLVIYRWDDGIGWQALDACATDSAQNSITCTTPGFSTFAIFGTLAPVAPPSQSSSRATTESTIAKKTKTYALVTPETSNIATEDSSTMPAQSAVTTDYAADQSALSSGAPTETVQLAQDVGKSDTKRFGLAFISIGFLCIGFFWFILAKRRRKKDNSQN